MVKNTLEQYKSAIRLQFLTAKNGAFADYFLKPSPARLRDLCCLLAEKGLGETDLKILSRFFNISTDEDVVRAIGHYDIDKLKPIRNFFVKGSELSAIESINLAALLVDLKERPFLKFKDSNWTVKDEPEPYKDVDPKKGPAPVKGQLFGKHFKKVMMAVGVALIGITAYNFKSPYSEKPKNCMEWRSDHFEAVSCEEKPMQGFANFSSVIPYDTSMAKNMRKISVTRETAFFNDGKPMIWYSKRNGVVEFFTAPGLNPVSGKTLKPITRYMIEKYVKK